MLFELENKLNELAETVCLASLAGRGHQPPPPQTEISRQFILIYGPEPHQRMRGSCAVCDMPPFFQRRFF